MKKLIQFVFTLVCVLSLTGCNNRTMDHIIANEPNITGIVKDTDENYIVIENETGEYCVSLNVKNEDSMTHFNQGDEVVVYFDGTIAESYPMQIHTVYAITLQTPADRTEPADFEIASKVPASSDNHEEDTMAGNDTLEVNFAYDYTEDIKADVDYVVSNSSSLQEELKNIHTITQKYALLTESAQTQGEMNVASQWLYMIWDTELNHLWGRFSSLADPDTKEKILEEQRNWIAMKEEVTLRILGSQEENGSMYPLLVNSLWEEKTRNRAYFIANELAKIKGEAFAMPENSAKYGLFVDNMETGSVYSSLNTRQNLTGEDEAVISIYRLGETEGSFIDHGNGTLDFTSHDGSIKGTIQINGWDGATFEVTETVGTVPFSVGEKFEFPFVF